MKTITLNFVGKSSVPFNRTIEVPDEVYEAIKACQEGKGPDEEIFDLAGSGEVNSFLKSIDKNLSPKVLRTARCNNVLIENLKKQRVNKNSTTTQKLEAIYNANYAIAKELNHQKNIGKNQEKNEDKSQENLDKSKKKLRDLKKDLKNLTAEVEQQKKEFSIKYENMPSMLKDKLTKLDEKLSKAQKRVKVQQERVDSCELKVKKTSETAEIALGTSLGNYADPRIIYSWCKDVDLPIEKVYNKSLQEKFSWASSVDEDYWRTL